MQTGNNIQYYRKLMAKTQEEFAEQMGVSRQTISKWESGSCYPEMEKLLLMCELFDCDLETLVRGDVAETIKEDSAGYDTHMNQFIKQICTGTTLTMTGVVMMMLLFGLGVSEPLAVIVLFSFIVIAVSFFVIGGIRHDDFVKKHPQITAFYTEAQIEAFQHKFPVFLVVGIALVLFGVMSLLGAAAFFGEARLDSDEQLDGLVMAAFLSFITVAAPFFIYAGMMKSKYDIETYNRENNPQKTPSQNRYAAISSCIMMTAVIIFLILGLVFKGWHINWIVFPVGGILCGIISPFMGEKKDNDAS